MTLATRMRSSNVGVMPQPVASAVSSSKKKSAPTQAKEPGACPLCPTDTFERRHIGPDAKEQAEMLKALGYDSLDALSDACVPKGIRLQKPIELPAPLSESQALAELRQIASQNQIWRSYIGMGYYGTLTPPVIQRNILENPGWYTAYTPYQAEIAQGRLEALLNFQTMITDLTGMDVANASLLDEGTAAAEAMHLARAAVEEERPQATTYWIAEGCHPQTIEVVRTRAKILGLQVKVGAPSAMPTDGSVFAALLSYPGTDGRIEDQTATIEKVHAAGALAIVATDLLALTLFKAPGEMGADVVLGSSQRFGVPLGYGGPHAAFFAVRDAYKRLMPGRLIGVSKDADGNPALRLSLQTREQHIRRDRATSNICTAQVLLSVIASMYAVYHGPEGLKQIAESMQRKTAALATSLKELGYDVGDAPFFDTLRVGKGPRSTQDILKAATAKRINLRQFSDDTIGVSLDETVTKADLYDLLEIFGSKLTQDVPLLVSQDMLIPIELKRKSKFLTHPVFNTHHTETECLRYIRRLESRDLSLTTSMIPLGSCTMKLNATAEMFPVTWPEFGRLHPFAPVDQTQGYARLFRELESWLSETTGFAATSLQPNAGSQGEYAGLLAIHEYHLKRGQKHRTVCLIPSSAHGTNPASAVMAGFSVVGVACDANGNIDLADLRAKAQEHAKDLACVMITYPSTHGVFEDTITEACNIIHEHGGQVYMDGANFTAQLGLCRPGDFGIDVCHLNLHKTFCIPHGGGGPGVGPICVAKHLAEFLPGHVLVAPHGRAEGAVCSAPWGSASILVISWMYCRMMGVDGLTRATQVAILNANYISKRLANYCPTLYTGHAGLVAHECILDLRGWKKEAGIEVEDVAKRLMDYGFHAPTMSWPVPGTLMVEPTESEDKTELDRFCEAMITIHGEMKAVASGKLDKQDNPLKRAPHTAQAVISDKWSRPYSREQAAYPAPWLRDHKFWPAVARIDNVYGDRNLVCTCLPVEAYSKQG